MNRIILASHGGLSAGMKDTVQMILGELPNLYALATLRDETEPITVAARRLLDGFAAEDAVYIVTDVMGGSVNNESFALVIALLMPVTVDLYVLIAAVIAGVLIGKEIFGGYGSYPFNPAAVGYVVAAVSWPEQVFRYPQPYTSIPLWDASMVPVSSAIEDTLRSGGMLNIGSLALGLG